MGNDVWDIAAKAVNKVGAAAEETFDKGKKALGEAVDKGTDVAAAGLHKVGADDAADAVEHWGDRTASDLGAHVREHQLGETDNPKELVRGDAKQIDAAAKHLRNFQKAFDTTHTALLKVRATDGWKGEGADAFTAKFVEQPKKWAEAADACEAAAGALEAYAHTVTWAQGQAKEAIRLHKRGRDTERKAVEAYNRQVDAYNASLAEAARNCQAPGPAPTKPNNPGKSDFDEAERILAEARKQRNTAAGEAKSKVDAAVTNAPQKPSFTNRMKATTADLRDGGAVEVLHVGGGALRAVTDMTKAARSLNPSDPYNLSHPAQYLSAVSNATAGMLSLASHPERVPATLVGEGWGKDPSEAGGRLAGNVALALLTGGGSAGAAAGERAAIAGARRGAIEGAEGAAARTGAAARSEARSGSRSGGSPGGKEAASKEAASAEKPPTPARQSANENPKGNTRDEQSVCADGTDPVDLATGHMYLPQTDVHLPGSLPLRFFRQVRSNYRAGRWLGPSWAGTADQRLEIDAEGVVFVCEDGMLLAYPHPAPGVPTLPADGPRWPLERTVDGEYVVTDPLRGLTWHFAPYDDELALLEQITDRNSHWITFEYAADGTPTGITHDSGYHIRITTDIDTGRITALHLADTELVRYGYTDGHLTEVFNSSGAALRFAYDEHGRVTSWTDRNGSSYRYAYDDRDRCVFESGVDGHMRAVIEYGDPDPESGQRVTSVTDALGHTTRHVFNDALQHIARTDPAGAVTRMRWDRYNRLLSHTDPLERTTEYRYDDTGRLTAVVRPDGRAATASYNDLGLPETVTMPDGSVWRHTYDSTGNRISTTDPTGALTRFTYDSHGHPTSVTDALGNTSRLRCNAAGLVTEVTDPLGGLTTYRRDALGRVTAVVDALGATTRMRWSVEGKLLRRVEPDGAEETWTYDGEGNCTTHTDALGATTSYEYTHFDLLAAQTGPDGVRHEFTHDALLRLTRVTNPQGLTWEYAYDAAGRLVGETDFDGRGLRYTHDAAGRLTARTNAVGQTITYEHDVLGRVVAKDVAGEVTTYAHDAAGRLLEAVGPDATLVYSRDRLGRVKSETTNGHTLALTYDGVGRRVRRVTPMGATSEWTYDAAGRRTSLSASGHMFDVEHDAVGREIARHFGNDVTLHHGWDEAGRLTSQRLTSGTTPLQTRSFTYRRDGYLTAVNDRTFDVDAAGRVTAVNAPGWQERYAYDEAGNQTHATWPTTHPGKEAQGSRDYTGTRITRAGGIRYEHDAQGRVVLRQKTRLSRKPDTWRYEWDAEDRLRGVTTPDGTRWRYLYDPLGRRTAKQRLAPDGTVAERTDFTWDGPTLTEQTTVSATLPNPVTLTWDHDGLRPVAQTERISSADAAQREIDSRFFAIVTDLVGSPTELVDEQGDIAWRTRSTLWGATTWPKSSKAYTPLRFPGQYFDPETGLHYNFHRHYDPETARYTSPDPLGLAPAPNPAAYVDNPHTWSDPFGLAPYHERDGSDGPANAANGERLRQQLREEAGPVGSIQGIEDIMDNPQVLSGGVTPDEVRGALVNRPGWREETLGKGDHAGQGWVLREYTERGHETGRMLRWHPGGGHHGDGAYWRVKGWEGDLGGIIR
ncbi:putative T7SS-secreted protein [Streptomyces sp. NPDC053048]|uniref:putative T7SS-secreted protein n=1 Tax=Streptomyces sp. NPDC053048 TaxID=3365694 RepID=UPI0037CED57B